MTSVESIPQFLLGGLPIVQPKHLEGDATFATEILPGPPSLLSVQQSGNRKDKKTSAPVSYLPASDPGTTYSVLGGVVTPVTTVVNADVDGPRRKRARTNKGASSARPQRVSARVLNANSAAADMVANGHEAALAWSAQALPESSMPPSSVIDVDEPMISRSHSSEETQSISAAVNGTNGKETAPARKDKGKAKEKPVPIVRIKEEPVAITFSLNDYGPPLSNDDHCSSCQSFGSLVYCDGCPKAFHLWCLDPPMEPQDLPEGENRWFCPSCTIQDHPPPRPSASLKFMSPLIQQLQCTAPLEFRLPEEIRAGFRDVAAGSRGNYIDTSRLKPPRLNRHGQLEDRDPGRLKDRSGDPVLCFQCGTSALPSDGSEPPAAKRPRRASNKLANPESWKSVISCDYCDLSWHLDCIDPPITTMPAFGVKWMCPNHAEHVHKPKRRIPKHNAAFIEISKPNQPNNGNIDVVPTEYLTSHESRVLVDEVMINGRRYRVPERIVKLDFWNKLNATQPAILKPDSRSSSPLTSLSSLDDSDDEMPVKSGPGLYSLDDVLAAQVLWNIRAVEPQIPETLPVPKTNEITNGSMVNIEQPVSSLTQLSTRNGKRKADETTVASVQPTVEATAPLPLGRRRSARKPAPVKRVKIEPSEETTTSDSSSPPTISRSHKATKPTAKAYAASTKKSDAVAAKSNGKASTKDISSTDLGVVNPSIKATKAKTVSSKTGKAVPSVKVKIEPETSPKPPATPSLKIRLPRLSGLTPVSASTSAVTALPNRKDSSASVPKAPRRKPSKKQLDDATYIS